LRFTLAFWVWPSGRKTTAGIPKNPPTDPAVDTLPAGSRQVATGWLIRYLPDTRVCNNAAQESNKLTMPAPAVRDHCWAGMERSSLITASSRPLA
jgi:hypothetical protein